VTAIVSVSGRITAVQTESGRVSHLLLKNPEGTFIVQAGAGCMSVLITRFTPEDQVLIGGSLRSTIDHRKRELTYIVPLYISCPPADLNDHLDAVFCMLLTGRQGSACDICPQNCRD
jgi:hypothetical protein